MTNKYETRLLELNDYNKNYIELMNQLSETIDKNIITEEVFKQYFYSLNKNEKQIVVIYDNEFDRIIASGTLLIETKLIHNLGKVGHVEDVVVNNYYRGHGIGKRIINKICENAKQAGCYKVILDCNDNNIKFYEKCGFHRKENQMRINL